MPRVSVVAVRAALIYLAVGATFGALMLWNEGRRLVPGIEQFVPVHREVMLVGWMLQLAFGVAYWILPRLSRGSPRGHPAAAWAALILLNAGIQLTIWSRVVGWPQPMVAVGRCLELAASLVFVHLAWPRVKAFGA